jgi:hypothetical protein
MKIKDILTESSTAPVIIANQTKFEDEFDSFYNPQADMIANLNRQYYKKYFKEFLTHGSTPVFSNTDNFEHDKEEKDWTHKPDLDSHQSAGYRGQQNALHKAGVPHDKNVKKYDPGPVIPLTPKNLDT